MLPPAYPRPLSEADCQLPNIAHIAPLLRCRGRAVAAGQGGAGLLGARAAGVHNPVLTCFVLRRQDGAAGACVRIEGGWGLAPSVVA
jgi:hypothetical protein